MIKINLLGEVEDSNSKYSTAIAAYAGSLVILLIVFFFVYTSTSSRVSELTQQIETLDSELVQLRKKTTEVKEFERMKNDLNNKLLVIATLKKSKRGPVRVMDDLNKSIPDRSWITEINEKENLMALQGFALDNQTISEFMRELEKSKYFQNVDLEESKTFDKEGVSIKQFKVKSKISYSGVFNMPKPIESEVESKQPKAKKKAKGEE